jgi:hypothetical protein
VNYGEQKLLDDNIIKPIPILQSFLSDHQSIWGHQGITIAKLSPSFSLSKPTMLAPISMAAIVTSFHNPYS